MFLGCSFFELNVSESTPNFSPHFNLSHLVKCIQLRRKKKSTDCTKLQKSVIKTELAFVMCFTTLDS